MTPEREAQIEARCDAATPETWLWRPFGGDSDNSCRVVQTRPDGWDVIADEIENPADAEFIAFARTDVPDLLAAVRKLRADRDLWKRMAKRREESLDALGHDRNTWARQIADLRDELEQAVEAARVAFIDMNEARNERDDLSMKLETAEETLARVEALCDEVVANWDALVGPRAHQLGCECGATSDGAHTCATFRSAIDALRGETT